MPFINNEGKVFCNGCEQYRITVDFDIGLCNRCRRNEDDMAKRDWCVDVAGEKDKRDDYR